jgi:two-component system chemotaxis sensor kinase CheA
LEAIRASALAGGAESIAQLAASTIAGIRWEAASDSFLATPEGIASLQRSLEGLIHVDANAPGSLAHDPELLTDFVLESREHLAKIEAQVLTLERDPCNSESLHSVFRSFHTIKGLAGFLELWEIQKLAHEVETVLDKARNSQLTITPASIDVKNHMDGEVMEFRFNTPSGSVPLPLLPAKTAARRRLPPEYDREHTQQPRAHA